LTHYLPKTLSMGGQLHLHGDQMGLSIIYIDFTCLVYISDINTVLLVIKSCCHDLWLALSRCWDVH